jgi:hypothetical protein
VVYTSEVLDAGLFHPEQEQRLRCCLSLFQQKLPKQLEIRVTVVCREVFAAEIHSQISPKTRIDWRKYDIANTPHYPHQLPKDVEEKCLSLTRHFGLDFNTIDLILDPDGRYWFLEMNPNGLWAWIESARQLQGYCRHGRKHFGVNRADTRKIFKDHALNY